MNDKKIVCVSYNSSFFSSSDVKASGPKGIVKSDVLSHIKSNGLQPIKVSAEPDAPKAAATSAPRPASKPTSGYTDHPLSSMRAVIAKRLSQSKQTSPHGHCTATADISALQAIRADYADAGFKVSRTARSRKMCDSGLGFRYFDYF